MRGQIARGQSSPAKNTNRKPQGLAEESTYPLTKKRGLKGKGANRVLKGIDKRGTGKSIVTPRQTSLSGRFF